MLPFTSMFELCMSILVLKKLNNGNFSAAEIGWQIHFRLSIEFGRKPQAYSNWRFARCAWHDTRNHTHTHSKNKNVWHTHRAFTIFLPCECDANAQLKRNGTEQGTSITGNWMCKYLYIVSRDPMVQSTDKNGIIVMHKTVHPCFDCSVGGCDELRPVVHAWRGSIFAALSRHAVAVEWISNERPLAMAAFYHGHFESWHKNC